MNNSRFITQLQKAGGQIVHKNKGEELLYDLFKQNLPEGAILDLYIEEVTEDGNLAQLAKIHAMIRDLSLHTGNTFSEMKLEVKKKAGLVLRNGDAKPKVKSFGKCSHEELGLAIQAAIEIGELVNYPMS